MTRHFDFVGTVPIFGVCAGFFPRSVGTVICPGFEFDRKLFLNIGIIQVF